MPKPNKKRIEERQDPNNRLKGAGKLYIPEGLTEPYKPITFKPHPRATIPDDELDRILTELLSSQQGYGKNFHRTRPRTD